MTPLSPARFLPRVKPDKLKSKSIADSAASNFLRVEMNLDFLNAPAEVKFTRLHANARCNIANPYRTLHDLVMNNCSTLDYKTHPESNFLI